MHVLGTGSEAFNLLMHGLLDSAILFAHLLPDWKTFSIAAKPSSATAVAAALLAALAALLAYALPHSYTFETCRTHNMQCVTSTHGLHRTSASHTSHLCTCAFVSTCVLHCAALTCTDLRRLSTFPRMDLYSGMPTVSCSSACMGACMCRCTRVSEHMYRAVELTSIWTEVRR